MYLYEEQVIMYYMEQPILSAPLPPLPNLDRCDSAILKDSFVNKQ